VIGKLGVIGVLAVLHVGAFVVGRWLARRRGRRLGRGR
jgi:hypothetical protein